MTLPEQVYDFFKRDLCGIEVDLQSFRMVPQTVIRRELFLATSVADTSSINAFENPKLGVGAPESAKGKRCSLQVVGNSAVNQWERCVSVVHHQPSTFVKDRNGVDDGRCHPSRKLPLRIHV